MDPAENRGAARVSLFMRGVRVMAGSAQVLCVMRDISQTGIRLKLFHPLPGDVPLAVDLGTGVCHPIEKVWDADGHAGLRFIDRIDPDAIVGSVQGGPRQPVSLDIDLPVVMSSRSQTSTAHIHTLSQSGARLTCDQPFAVRQNVTLDADCFPARAGTVEWRRSPAHSIVFQKSFALDELARLAARLQGLPMTDRAVAAA